MPNWFMIGIIAITTFLLTGNWPLIIETLWDAL